jgi:hypothetical protein
MAHDNDSPVATKVAAGAPETEIKITPEMTEAGVMELCSYDSAFESREEAVAKIFKAMSLMSLK